MKVLWESKKKKDKKKENKKEDFDPKEEKETSDVSSPKGLSSKIEELNKKLEDLSRDNKTKKREKKQFGLPSKVKREFKKISLKKKILVIFLSNNRGMIPMVREIKDGVINIDDKPYDASMDYMFLWKGKVPAIVIKEWDLSPVGTKDYYDAVKENRLADPVSVAIRMIENSQNPSKPKISPKWWVFIGLGVIAFLWVLFGGSA